MNRSSIHGTRVVIDLEPPIDSEVLSTLSPFDLSPAKYVLIALQRKIIELYPGDENVRERFVAEGCLAMNRNSQGDGEVLVAFDKHAKAGAMAIDEAVISVLHEVEHIRGVRSEKAAEKNAREAFAKVYGDAGP